MNEIELGFIDATEIINREQIAADRKWHQDNPTDCEDCGGRATRIFAMCFWTWHVCEECYRKRCTFKTPVRFGTNGMVLEKPNAPWSIVDGKVHYKEARS